MKITLLTPYPGCTMGRQYAVIQCNAFNVLIHNDNREPVYVALSDCKEC